MKIEKLPSGSYRIRKMYKGITYTVVTDYKPTQKEALQLLAAEMDKIKPTAPAKLDFEAAAKQYISVKANVLSPSTTNGYRGILRNISGNFKKSDNTLKTVYRHAMDEKKEMQKFAAQYITELIDQNP